MPKIKIITGSSRPGRFNIQPVEWLESIAKSRSDAEVQVLDLAVVNLPFLNEPNAPMKQQYEFEHTKQWAQEIAEADGFVFVTPEYNHSFSPLLKNAIDYLYREWNYKPVAFVSYGSLAGGSRAVEHLRAVAAELKMYDLREQILLPNYWEHLNDAGAYQFTEAQTESAQHMLDALVFWSNEMKASRAKLAQS
jgi:NAD(P)H-dependent FMN reductase